VCYCLSVSAIISIHAYIYSYDVSFWLIINYNFMLPFLKLLNQLLGLCLCIVVASFINIHINTSVIVLYKQCSPGQAMVLLDVL